MKDAPGRPKRLAGLGVLALATMISACQQGSSDRGREAKKPEAPREVKVAAAQQGALPRVITINGTLAAEQQVAMGFKVAGRISEMNVDLGSAVKKGDALARLAPIDFQLKVQQSQAALQQARARLGLAAGDAAQKVDPQKTSLVRQSLAVLEEAKVGLARAQELSKKALMPRSELDAASAAYKVAEGRYQDSLEEALNRQALVLEREAELEQAQQQMADSVLYAPFDGSVRERAAVAGQYVSAGQPVVTVVKVDPLRLQLTIPEREAVTVQVQQKVRITISGDPKVYEGRIARLSPAIDERSRTLMVEAEVPNPAGELRPGAFATSEIVTSADLPVVFVPTSSIITFAGIEKVILVNEGKSVEKPVRTGRKNEDKVEIVSGVAAGDLVVLEPGNLVGGQAVTVLP